jgi:hypothetical protein
MESHSAVIDWGNHTRAPKRCVVCGCAIPWRRWRAAAWDKVKYCRASCRRAAIATARTAGEVPVEGRAPLPACDEAA